MARSTADIIARATNRDRVVRYIREQRQAKGWDTAEFARLAKIPYTTLYKIESGNFLPSTDSVDRIARALAVHPNVLRQLAGHELLPGVPALPEPVDLPHEIELLRQVLQDMPLPLRDFARHMIARQADYLQDCADRWTQEKSKAEAELGQLLHGDPGREGYWWS